MPAPYETTPPADNPQIARIMAERGVGRRRAYALAKVENAAAIDTTNIPLKQSLTVMNVLIHDGNTRKTAAALQRVLRDHGSTLDMHDTTKTLWALQKMGWVRFYERNNKGLTAIRITPDGYDGYKAALAANGKMQMGFRVEESHQDGDVTVIDKAVITSVTVDTKSLDAALDEAQETIKEFRRAQEVPRWWKYPSISMLMDRAAKAEKLQAAAALLAEVGEDDMALTIMAMAEFTQLEKEVIDLIKEGK